MVKTEVDQINLFTLFTFYKTHENQLVEYYSVTVQCHSMFAFFDLFGLPYCMTA